MTTRWTIKRKAEIAMQALKEPEKAKDLMAKHNIAPEELETWCERLVEKGIKALRTTHCQEFRRVAANT